jgi:hypothetical protein
MVNSDAAHRLGYNIDNSRINYGQYGIWFTAVRCVW